MGGRFFNFQVVFINVFQLVPWTHSERCDGKILSLGGYYGDRYGSFYSPNYPSNYETKDSCTWSIKVQSGYRVKLTFTDFDLENCSFCECDSVTVIEGKPSEAKVINKFCGQETPPIIRASGRYLKVKFHSDYKRSKKGFTANYVAFKVGEEDEDLTTLAPPPTNIYASSERPTDGKSDTIQGHSVIIIAVLSSIAGIALIGVAAIVCLRRSRDSGRGRNSSPVSPPSASPPKPVPTIPPAVSIPPPTYSEAVGNFNSNSRPPPYNVAFVPSL